MDWNLSVTPSYLFSFKRIQLGFDYRPKWWAFITFYIFRGVLSKGQTAFYGCYITLTCAHLHPLHPHVGRLSSSVQLAPCVRLRMCILCQIQHRHKQDFRCVFEWASPCLVSFPSPESSKGPSIRGQAAVTASFSLSLSLSPSLSLAPLAGQQWGLGRGGVGGGGGAETIGLDTGHGTPHPFHPSLAHPVWGTGHLVMCYYCCCNMLPVIVGKEHEIEPRRLREGERAARGEVQGQDWTSLLSQLFSHITDSGCLRCCCLVHIVSFGPLCSFVSLVSLLLFFFFHPPKPRADRIETSSTPNPTWCFLLMARAPSTSTFSAPLLPPISLQFLSLCVLIASRCISITAQFCLRPGSSQIWLFYVSSVLVVTRPEVCSKTHRLMFSPVSLQLSPQLPPVFFPLLFSSVIFLPLSPSPPCPPLRETLAACNNFRTICGIASCDVDRGCSLDCQQGPPSFTQAIHSDPSLSSSAVIGLDVILTLTLMCWDVVCKFIADILGTWCQRFFISRFSPSLLCMSARS